MLSVALLICKIPLSGCFRVDKSFGVIPIPNPTVND